MTQTKKISLFHMIAGVLFVVTALRQLYLFARTVLQSLEYGYAPNALTLFLFLLSAAVYVIAAAGLLAGAVMNRQDGLMKLLPLIGLGALALVRLLVFFIGFLNYSYAVYDYWSGYSFNPLCVLPALVSLAGHIALAAFAAAFLLDQAQQIREKVRFLWFIPGVCVLLPYLMSPVIAALLRLFDLEWFAGIVVLNFSLLVNLFFNTVYIAAILLAALGFSFPDGMGPGRQTHRSSPYQTGGSQTPGGYSGSGSAPRSGFAPGPGPAPDNPPRSSENAAEELRQYKALLDSGVITQEDYDAKKKQLLGL